MLDAKLIRNNPKIVYDSLKKRGMNSKVLDDWISQDKKYRKLKGELDLLRSKRNTISEQINILKKSGKEAEARKKIEEAKSIPDKIKSIETELEKLEKNLHFLLMSIPNIISKDAPIGKSESDNKVTRQVNPKKFNFKAKDHIDLGTELKIIDIERASKVSGARFYYLKNEAVLLGMALQKFAADFLRKKGFNIIQPPFMLKKEPYEGVVDFGAFEETLYKIENEDLYLIATSEHPIAAYFMNETIESKDLPIKFAGVSPCFRKEAGSHGKDTKGIFRVHQFDKVEQFIFCRPKESEKFHRELLKNLEDIYRALKIPFRTVLMCSSEMGKTASKQYDIEAWFPCQNAYREVGSCSICTDYQARGLNIKFINEKNEKEFVHTLNSTVMAVQRTIAAILENYQQKDGSVKIPTVLQKYCGMKKIFKK